MEVDATALVEPILATGDEGITFSGGEPFEQAQALARLAAALRGHGLSIMAYSGYSLEELTAEPTPGSLELLGQLDLLIDGPFEAAQQGDLLWRGSSNQRIHVLSGRHAELDTGAEVAGVGIEMRVDAEGRLFWAGVPGPGFQAGLRRAAVERGLTLQGQEGVWA